MSKRHKSLPRPRTTVELTGTHSRAEVLHSFESDLSVKYAVKWLSRADPLRVPASGIVRRALAIYLKHLASANPADEFVAVRRACKVLPVDPAERNMAELRLSASAAAEQLPPFEAILRSTEDLQEARAYVQRIDALVEQSLGAIRPRAGQGKTRP